MLYFYSNLVGTPNRVLIWIDGHIPSRVVEFFLTDWIQEDALYGHRIG